MITISIACTIPLFARAFDDIDYAINCAVVPVADQAHVVMWFTQEILHLVISIIYAPRNIEPVRVIRKSFRERPISRV
jgi:hypothetical protein